MDTETLIMMKDELNINKTTITLSTLDEIMVANRISSECYCSFDCNRCPHNGIVEPCNGMVMRCLTWDIFHSLFDTDLTMNDMIFCMAVINHCMEEGMDIDDTMIYFEETFGIEIIDTLPHKFRLMGEDDEEE